MFSKQKYYFTLILLIFLSQVEFAHAKTCSKGKPCGNTCIALSYTCHIGESSGSSSSSSSTTTTTPIVTNTNLTPIASFSYFINESAQLILFDASSSLDSDGSIQSYDWSLSNGQTFSGKTANAILPSPGNYTIELTVTDDKGKTNSTNQTFTVIYRNKAPNAVFAYTIQNDEAVSVDANASYDQDGFIQNYSWSTSNGQNANGKTATFSFTENGIYDINLLVTDDKGSTAEKTYQVVIQKPIVATIPENTTTIPNAAENATQNDVNSVTPKTNTDESVNNQTTSSPNEDKPTNPEATSSAENTTQNDANSVSSEVDTTGSGNSQTTSTVGTTTETQSSISTSSETKENQGADTIEKSSCMATYEVMTGELRVPCLSIKDIKDYAVVLKQEILSLTFNLQKDIVVLEANTNDKCTSTYNLESGEFFIPCLSTTEGEYEIYLQRTNKLFPTFEVDATRILKK